MDRDLYKRIEEFSYRRGVLESLLVSSVSENSFRFPAIKEFILSEVVNGTIDYIGGEAGKTDYQKFRLDRNMFERELSRYFKAEMEAHSEGRMSPRVRKAITKLCEYYYIDPSGPDRPYPHTELYSHFEEICPVRIESSFSLPQEIVIRVEREVLPGLPEQERRDVSEIGRAMRKYIDRDLEFIRKNYRW